MAIEYTVLNYINRHLTGGIQAYMEEPADPEDEYIIIEKTGSSVKNHINRATFAVQSYSTSMQGAIDLNEAVKGIMEVFCDENSIFSCRLNSDYNFTDTETQRYRYQAVFDITY